MDGLSVAASIASILSSSIRLAQVSQDLVEFLDKIRDAPNEIIRLKDQIRLIFALSSGVRNNLEYQKRLQDRAVVGQEHIYEALMACQKSLYRIQTLLEKAENVHTGRTLVSRSWAKFKLAVKKEHITELETQLIRDVNILNCLLTTSLLHTTTLNTARLLDKIETHNTANNPYEIVVSRKWNAAWKSSSPLPRLNGNSVSVAKNYGIPTTTSTHNPQPVQKPTAIKSREISIDGLGSIFVTKKLRRKLRCNLDGPKTEFETVYVKYAIQSTFLSRSISMIIYYSGHYVPGISLRFAHNMPGDLYSRKILPLIMEDDVRGFRRLITNGECTIGTVGPFQVPLIDLAGLMGSWDMVAFLAKQGCLLAERAVHFIILFRSSQVISREPAQDLMILFSKLDLTDCNPSDFIPGPEYGVGSEASILDAVSFLSIFGLQRSVLLPRDFLGSLLNILCAWWGRTEQAGLQEWRELLATKLIKKGADIHWVDRNGATPLYNLISHSYPQNDFVMVQCWLRLLEGCQVRLEEYLDEECRLYPNELDLQARHLYSPTMVRKISKQLLMTQSFNSTETRYIDPGSPAALLVQEFNIYLDATTDVERAATAVKLWGKRWRYYYPKHKFGHFNWKVLAQCLERYEITTNDDKTPSQFLGPNLHSLRIITPDATRVILERQSFFCDCDERVDWPVPVAPLSLTDAARPHDQIFTYQSEAKFLTNGTNDLGCLAARRHRSRFPQCAIRYRRPRKPGGMGVVATEQSNLQLASLLLASSGYSTSGHRTSEIFDSLEVRPERDFRPAAGRILGPTDVLLREAQSGRQLRDSTVGLSDGCGNTSNAPEDHYETKSSH
ncbi:hypothetical protein NUW58_g3127 [Xylaria curta]|uniref:Uncharacterized protein n=1 Tax=Xylaria curta TaxID=42375 RepID=A0ACC1PER4_9PEZI|nr:hypothetical protein NUW58_g3127 [Xylaria curta]